MIAIAYGAADGFHLEYTDKLTQGLIYGNAAHDTSYDEFGYAFGVGDFDHDGYDDLAVGHPGDKWSGVFLGAVTILMGGIPPLGPSTRHHLIGVGWEGVPGNHNNWNQNAGYALAVGDFDGTGLPDLAFGVPGYGGNDYPKYDVNLGAEIVLYSAWKLFSDGLESGATNRWSGAGP